jgi:uncharacterized protein (TIGR02284 family)
LKDRSWQWDCPFSYQDKKSRQKNRLVAMGNNDVIDILNDLIETCRDGQEGYRVAAANIQNSEFRRLFNIFAQQRVQFVSELQSEVHRLGGEAVTEGSVAGRVHRGWLKIKSKALGGDEASIVAGCQSGEEAAINAYQDALKADLPLDVQYVVKRQYMDIRDAYDRIRILQRAA